MKAIEYYWLIKSLKYIKFIIFKQAKLCLFIGSLNNFNCIKSKNCSDYYNISNKIGNKIL